MCWIQKILKIVVVALRASHCAHAAIAVEHDWPLITHGIIPLTTVFAVYVLYEAVQHLLKFARRLWRERLERRAEAVVWAVTRQVVSSSPMSSRKIDAAVIRFALEPRSRGLNLLP